jgi:hypothetical protein
MFHILLKKNYVEDVKTKTKLKSKSEGSSEASRRCNGMSIVRFVGTVTSAIVTMNL